MRILSILLLLLFILMGAGASWWSASVLFKYYRDKFLGGLFGLGGLLFILLFIVTIIKATML